MKESVGKVNGKVINGLLEEKVRGVKPKIILYGIIDSVMLVDYG